MYTDHLEHHTKNEQLKAYQVLVLSILLFIQPSLSQILTLFCNLHEVV